MVHPDFPGYPPDFVSDTLRADLRAAAMRLVYYTREGFVHDGQPAFSANGLGVAMYGQGWHSVVTPAGDTLQITYGNRIDRAVGNAGVRRVGNLLLNSDDMLHPGNFRVYERYFAPRPGDVRSLVVEPSMASYRQVEPLRMVEPGDCRGMIGVLDEIHTTMTEPRTPLRGLTDRIRVSYALSDLWRNVDAFEGDIDPGQV